MSRRLAGESPSTAEAAPPTSLGVAPPPISRWAIVGLGTAVAFFALTAGVSYRNQKSFVASQNLAEKSRLLMAEVGEMVSSLQSAEAAQRAYFFTNEGAYLTSYYQAVGELPQKLKNLDDLAGDVDQRSSIAALRDAASKRVSHLAYTLDLGRTEGRAAAEEEVRTGSGRALMNDVLAAARQFRDRERQVVDRRETAAKNALWLTHVSDLLTAAVGLGLAVAAFVRLRKEFLERHAVARDLDEQRELLQVTLHSIGDAVVATDPEGKVRMLNAVAERLTGWPSQAASERPSADVLQILDERSRSKVESPALQAIREGRLVRQSGQVILIGKDGTERRIENSAAPIRTPDGRVLGAVLTFRDVTERKRAEEALRRGEERLRRALRASQMVAWEIDLRADVVVRSGNAADLTGLPGFGPVSESLALVHPDDRARVEAELAQALRGEGDYDTEYRNLLPDGRVMWVADKGEVRRNSLGEPTHVVGVFMDITSRRQAEESLREADVRKDRFLATLAHELRNPLAPISNALQAWPFLKDDPAELERLRDTMNRQVGQMTRLIDDLMDVSRITRGKVVLDKKLISLRGALEAAIEGVTPLIQSRQHRLVVSCPEPSPRLVADQARLVQIFSNLLANAAKYTDEGGRIDVTAALERGATGRVSISVADNGPGIPRPMLSRIFEMFAQVDQTLDRAHGGLGIGLTLVKTLVELHGGTVEAESPGTGMGTTITISLPLGMGEPPGTPSDEESPKGAAKAAASSNATASSIAAAPSRVLVVDDMRPSARTMSLLLQGIGHEVRIANDGPGALACINEFDPEVVLLDIAMPGMNGYEVARRIREREGRQPMLVALTGYGREEDRADAFEAGFDRHLVKPASLDDLKSLFDEAASIGHSPANR
jgi:PAS domain S-box-containing protein